MHDKWDITNSLRFFFFQLEQVIPGMFADDFLWFIRTSGGWNSSFVVYVTFKMYLRHCFSPVKAMLFFSCFVISILLYFPFPCSYFWKSYKGLWSVWKRDRRTKQRVYQRLMLGLQQSYFSSMTLTFESQHFFIHLISVLLDQNLFWFSKFTRKDNEDEISHSYIFDKKC